MFFLFVSLPARNTERKKRTRNLCKYKVMDDLKDALLSTGQRKARTFAKQGVPKDSNSPVARPKLKGLGPAVAKAVDPAKTKQVNAPPQTTLQSEAKKSSPSGPKPARTPKVPMKTKKAAGVTKKARTGRQTKAKVVQESPGPKDDNSTSSNSSNSGSDSDEDDDKPLDSSDDSDSEEIESDSDSAEETRLRVSRRRNKKTKIVPVPEMNNVFRVDTTRINQHKLKGSDVLRGDVFRPSMAEQICAMYSNSIWMPDSTVGQQLFEPDRSMQQGKCSIPGVSFADPRNYRVIQEMLKRHPKNKTDDKGACGEVMLAVVPIVSREFEQMQLRTPRGQERSCVNGKECICNRRYGFIMKEFLLPDELAKLQAHSQVDVAVKPCLVCERDTALFISVYIAATAYAPPRDCILQRYRNLVNIEGEYKFEDSLKTGPGMLYPMMMNKIDGYEVLNSENGFCLNQSGYDYPDFQ